jgi:hypothetical protein
MPFSIPFPDIGPEVFSVSIGNFEFALRWYALAYIAGILIGWRIIVAAVKRPALWPGDRAPMTPGQVEEFLTWAVLGIIAGGRLGYTLFYQPAYYLSNPVEILYIWQGGMSFHGGFLGVVAAGCGSAAGTAIPVAQMADALALAAPPGILLGRLANFVNAELWGRPTDLPWGVIFPGERAQDCPGVGGPLRAPSLAALRGRARGARAGRPPPLARLRTGLAQAAGHGHGAVPRRLRRCAGLRGSVSAGRRPVHHARQSLGPRGAAGRGGADDGTTPVAADATRGAPDPRPRAAAGVSGLLPLLLRRIRQTGPLTVADYMAECLTHPVHGYYTTRDPLGAAGDFVTAPEVSQMFGELLGLCLAQAWLDQGAPAPFALAELGPGRGTLMADILRATRGVPGFLEGAEVHLVEVSPALRARQAEALGEHRPTWHAGLAGCPDCLSSSSPTNSSTRCRCASSCGRARAGPSASWGPKATGSSSGAQPLPRSPRSPIGWRTPPTAISSRSRPRWNPSRPRSARGSRAAAARR